MTDTSTSAHPLGLLTEAEAEELVDPEKDLDELTDVRARIRTRLRKTLRDFSVLYPTLPAEDLNTVFAPTDSGEQSAVRVATQDGLALLVLGMLHGDGMIEMRLQDAIVNAGVSYGEDIDVTLKLRRGPLPTLEQFATQVDADGLTEQTLSLFEYFLSQPDADHDTLDAIASDMQMEITEADRQEMQTALAPLERHPHIIITGISVTDQPTDNDQGPDP